jgi:hypothetical protein
MRQHEKADRQEARLETRREAEAHLTERAYQEERLAIANAPILAEIAELEAELANQAPSDELSWLAEWEYEREREQHPAYDEDDYGPGNDVYEDSYDPEWQDEMDEIDLLYVTPLHLFRPADPPEVERQPSWLQLRLDDDPFPG